MSLITINLNCDNAAVLAAIANLKETTMSAFDDLQAAQTANASATQSLIDLTNSIKDQLDALANAGTGATDDQIKAMQAQVDQETANIATAITRDTPAAPAPAPVAP